MEQEVIKSILQKYFDGESSLEDKRMLHNYFHSEEVDAELLPFQEFFRGIEKLNNGECGLSEDELMDAILKEDSRQKIRYRRLGQVITGIAAVLLLALFVLTYNNNGTGWKDTYTDPDMAYAEASRAFEYVAENYRAGLAKLQPVNKLNQAVQPMTDGLDLLNRGFYEVENIREVMKEMKQ